MARWTSGVAGAAAGAGADVWTAGGAVAGRGRTGRVGGITDRLAGPLRPLRPGARTLDAVTRRAIIAGRALVAEFGTGASWRGGAGAAGGR